MNNTQTQTDARDILGRLVDILEQKGVLSSGDARYAMHGQEDVILTNSDGDGRLERLLTALGLDQEPDFDVLHELFEQALAEGNSAAHKIYDDTVRRRYEADGI